MTDPISTSAAAQTPAYDPAVRLGAEADALVAEHTAYGVVQTNGLAQALTARGQADPDTAARLTAEVEATLSPVDRAALTREMEALTPRPAANGGEEGFGAFLDG